MLTLQRPSELCVLVATVAEFVRLVLDSASSSSSKTTVRSERLAVSTATELLARLVAAGQQNMLTFITRRQPTVTVRRACLATGSRSRPPHSNFVLGRTFW